jgi:hypothetical protein
VEPAAAMEQNPSAGCARLEHCPDLPSDRAVFDSARRTSEQRGDATRS